MENINDKPELELLKVLIEQQKQSLEKQDEFLRNQDMIMEKQDKFLHNQERIIAWLKLSNKQPISIIPKELFK